MKIFNLNIGWNKPTVATTTENKSIENFRTVSTDGMDLSQPFVDDYFNRGHSWVHFGEGNMYPQILNQLYISSPMHQACCNFKKFSLIGNGYEWEGYDKLDTSDKIAIKQFETQSNWRKATEKLSLDSIKHGRAIVLLRYSKQFNKYLYAKVVDPENFRNNLVEFLSERPTRYFYSRDWNRQFAMAEFTPYAIGNKEEWQVLEYRNEVGGFKSYGMPDWMSSANWQKVGADIALLHKSAIENGIQPSVIYKYPYLMSPDERDRWAEGMRASAKGAKNYGRAMKIEAQSKDLTPDIEVVKTTDNHKLFEQTSKEYKEEVAISHGIDPALMGVRIAGSLGAQDEKEFSAEQFNKIWVKGNRQNIEEFLNQITTICGVGAKLKINETDLLTISEIIQEGGTRTVESGEPVSTDKEADARAQLKGSVGGVQGIIQIQSSVAQGLTDRGSAIALLELIYGFSNKEAIRLLGDVQEGSTPQPTSQGQPTEQMSANTNDNLKGLSAKDNQDLMRIVRDYSKGRLVESLARTRLMAYGIDNETINEILTV